MSGMKDHFYGDQYAPDRYPNGPGWTDQKTGRAAAKSIVHHIGPLHAKIMTFLHRQQQHGATYSEIMFGCNLGAPTVTGRMVELVHMGLVKIAAHTRPTPSGRAARVYLAAEFVR